MNPGQAKCGAKTRGGTPCKDIAMKNGRCKRHGGKSTGPKTPNTAPGTAASKKFGIYDRFLSPEDQALYNEVELGHVDEELRLVRVRLSRTVRARRQWEESLVADGDSAATDGSGAHVLVESVSDTIAIGEGENRDLIPTEKKTFRLPDFDKIEQACLARIESLEKTRKELLKTGTGDDDETGEPGSAKLTITGGLPARRS